MQFEKLTEKIIGWAYQVYNQMGFGYLESVKQINKSHEIQLVNYLVATKKDVGLLINFGAAKVEVKRKVREL